MEYQDGTSDWQWITTGATIGIHQTQGGKDMHMWCNSYHNTSSCPVCPQQKTLQGSQELDTDN